MLTVGIRNIAGSRVRLENQKTGADLHQRGHFYLAESGHFYLAPIDAPRIICTMLKCPPRKDALRACRSAGCLIAMTDQKNSGPQAALTPINLSVFQPTEVVRCWPFEGSTVLAVSRADLDTAATRCWEGRPTALAVSG